MDNIVKQELMNWTSGKVKGFHGKQLIEKKNGGLKIVKVDGFSVYPEHIHPDKTEFAYVLQGRPEMLIGGKKYAGEKNDFFIFPSGINHGIKNSCEEVCLLIIGSFKE